MFRLALRCVNRQLQQVLSAFFRLNRVLRSNSLTGNWTVGVRYRTESLGASYVKRDFHFLFKGSCSFTKSSNKNANVGLFSYLALFRPEGSEFFLTRIRIRILNRIDPHWFGSLDPDPDPHWDKKLDPDPYWHHQVSSECESLFDFNWTGKFKKAVMGWRQMNYWYSDNQIQTLKFLLIIYFIIFNFFYPTMKCTIYLLQFCSTACEFDRFIFRSVFLFYFGSDFWLLQLGNHRLFPFFRKRISCFDKRSWKFTSVNHSQDVVANR